MQEILQKIIDDIEKQGFNKFVMTNNITDEKILGYKLKTTTKPNLNIFDYHTNEYAKQELCLELDRTQDLVLQNFANEIAFRSNMEMCKKVKGQTKWLKTISVSYVLRNDTIIISYGDVRFDIECQKESGRNYNSDSFPDDFYGFDLYDIKYLDYENSLIDGSKTYAVIDTYKLGVLSDNQIEKLKLEYIDLLNCDKDIKSINDEYEAKKYKRSASPYCMYNEEHKRYYIGLWDNLNQKPLSSYSIQQYKYKVEHIKSKIKALCDEVYKYNVCGVFDLDLFGIKIDNCVLLK